MLVISMVCMRILCMAENLHKVRSSLHSSDTGPQTLRNTIGCHRSWASDCILRIREVSRERNDLAVPIDARDPERGPCREMLQQRGDLKVRI